MKHSLVAFWNKNKRYISGLTWTAALIGFLLALSILYYIYPSPTIIPWDMYQYYFPESLIAVGIFFWLLFICIMEIVRSFRTSFLNWHKKRLPRNWIYLPILFLGIISLGPGLIYLEKDISLITLTQSLSSNEKEPVLTYTADPQFTISIAWETHEPLPTSLQLGTSPSHLNYSFTRTDLSPSYHHEIDLIGLHPNTLYYYKVSGFSTLYNFTTAPSINKDFTFIAYGDNRYNTQWYYDPQDNTSYHQELLKTIAKKEGNTYSFIINVGDVVMSGGDRSQWYKFFQEIHYSNIAATHPYMIALGNHEYFRVDSQGLPGYNVSIEYLNYDAPDSHAFIVDPNYVPSYDYSIHHDPYEEMNYWFNYSNCLFIFMNTGIKGEPPLRTVEWVKSVLDRYAENYRWVFLCFHYPLYSSGEYGQSANDYLITHLEPLFHWPNGSLRVNFVLSGHRHVYERLHKDGWAEFVLGGGGAGMDSTMEPYPLYSQAHSAHTYHYARFRITPESVIYEAVSLNGTVFDTCVYN